MARRSRYQKIQHKIYRFVLKNMKLGKDNDSLYWDILSYMDETDAFWTSSFDEVYYELEKKPKSADFIEEAVEEAIEQVYIKIYDFYTDRWNHPPDYNPNLLGLPADLKYKKDDLRRLVDGL